MRKLVLSVAAITAMGIFAIAGGDITPAEEPEFVVEEVAAPFFKCYHPLEYKQ